MPISTGNFGKLLWPGLNAVWGIEYKEHPEEHPQIFKTYPSTKAFEEDISATGFGLATIKAQGQSIDYDTQKQGFVTRYTNVTYGLGFIVTREMMEDNQYDQVGLSNSRKLAMSMRTTKDTVAANVLNRGFNSDYVGGDGVELFSSVHPNAWGGTYRNELATPADISETSLEQACIDVNKLQNDRGLPIAIMPEKLVIPPELEFEVGRILKSQLQNDTANNAINVLKATGKFPGGYHINHYLDDDDAWFIITNCPDGMKHFQRRKIEFAPSPDNDFDTENAKFKATERYSFGWSDARGAFASEGA